VKEGDHLEDPSVNGKMILKLILDKQDVNHGLDRSGLVQGQVADSCKSGNEPSSSIKCGVFVDQLKIC
jgi:hypothetical protein